MIKITNSDANEVVNVYSAMSELKERGEITNFEIKYDEVRKILHLRTVPVTATKYIHVNFTISPTGCTYQ